MRVFRYEPDVLAVAVLSCLMLAPAVWAARPPRSGDTFRIRAASAAEFELLSNPPTVESLDDLAVWTNALERRGERVWERLSERMRRFEERFARYSTAPPPSRHINCETDSE